jgi:4-carboxymuconolactone decarboxylase
MRHALRADRRGGEYFKLIEGTAMTSKLHDKGLAMRKEVLGAAHVEKTLAGVDKYTQPLQEIVNEYVWGAVWARPGLKPRDRSMITIAMLTALNRPQELKTHIRAALTNGVTREEVSEILLHANVYCGAPAAVDAFRMMREVFDAK